MQQLTGDTITGTSGGDILMGGEGDDILIGGGGNDELVGGLGIDTLTGGDDRDTFVIDDEVLSDITMVDVITDYEIAEGDALDLGNLLDAAFGDGDPSSTNDADVQAAVKLQANGGNTDVLIDTNGADPDPAGEIVVAQLTGAYDTIKILYDGGNETEVSIP